MGGAGPTSQPPRPVRVACPRFPAAMREALRWDRGVRTYDDLGRLYAERGKADPSHSSGPDHPAETLSAREPARFGFR